MVVPTRGSDWDDGGDWRRMHLHAWTREDGNMNGGWNFGFGGVNTANRLIYQFEVLVEDGSMDARCGRRIYCRAKSRQRILLLATDRMYGNVPLVTDFANAEATACYCPKGRCICLAGSRS